MHLGSRVLRRCARGRRFQRERPALRVLINHTLDMASSNLEEANEIDTLRADDAPPPLAALFLIKFDLKVGCVLLSCALSLIAH
jgi:hypothetical protein